MPGIEGTIFDGNRSMRAQDLRADAQKCQRLASESLDPVVKEAMIELASDYERQAERLEQQRQEGERDDHQ
jgi:hypothetical protein